MINGFNPYMAVIKSEYEALLISYEAMKTELEAYRARFTDGKNPRWEQDVRVHAPGDSDLDHAESRQVDGRAD